MLRRYWPPDGQFLLFHTLKPASLFVAPIGGPGDARLLFNAVVDVWNARFSPDNKWIAYQTTEGNTYQVWVASFPAFDQQRRVSTSGGVQPVWGRNGKERFYLSPTGTLMLVPLDRTSAGAIEFQAPVELFQSPLLSPTGYAVSNDSQRFLFIRPRSSKGAQPPITVVMNWAAELKE